MRIRGRYMVVLSLLVLLLTGCGRPEPESQAIPPTVVITAPSSGQQIPVGDEITILVAASDPVGVTRVELGVDGVLLYTAANPPQAANSALSVQYSWSVSAAGSHAIMAVAYNTSGVASSPVVVNVMAVAGSETVEAPDVVATATWTPIPVLTDAPPAPLPSTQPAPPSRATDTPTPTESGAKARPQAPGLISDFEEFGAWRRGDQANGTFTQSTEQVHSGTYAGKLEYNFGTGGNDYVVFLQTHPLGGEPNQISAWVFGDGSKHFLNVWIQDAIGETWQFPLGQVKHTGWQEMSARLDPSAPWPAGHIDGPSDGVIEYPIDFRGLVLDDVPDAYTGSGAIYVDALRCEQASASLATPTSSPQPAPETPSVSFGADDPAVVSGECTRLRWVVENVREIYLDGEGVVGQGNRKVCPTAATTYRLRVVRLDGSEQIYEVRIEVTTS